MNTTQGSGQGNKDRSEERSPLPSETAPPAGPPCAEVAEPGPKRRWRTITDPPAV